MSFCVMIRARRGLTRYRKRRKVSLREVARNKSTMEEWHVFSTSIGKCVVERASLALLQPERFCSLIGIRESDHDAGLPDVSIQLMNGALPDFSGEATIFSCKNRALFYHGGEKRFRILHDDRISSLWIWKFGMFCSCLAYTLRRKNSLMMHGALLEMPDGSGIALCGPSGMGKSTTARRWIAAGGVCHADDFFWLLWRDGGIYAYPLPTWSRCEKSLTGEFFPVDHGIPLKTVLALGRGPEREFIEPLSPAQFLHSIYSSAIYFEQIIVGLLPSPDKEQFVKIVQENAQKLASAFPCECLRAHLDGDLRATLKRFGA